ncbi:MAG: hypothetical protein IKH95_00275 [Bacteroidaceae bacterium]|nr:hypothetical protein [Bacteroidaceae bacterium]
MLEKKYYLCPYCYIGETRLQRAIREQGLENEVEILVVLSPSRPLSTA